MSDISKILVSGATEDFEIKYKDDVFKFRLRKLPWLQVTEILSKATSYTQEETAQVNMRLYYEEYLVAALVEAPWNLEESRFILRKLDPEFGDLLEKHVPKPGIAETEKISFFGKGSGQSSPAESQTSPSSGI